MLFAFYSEYLIVTKASPCPVILNSTEEQTTDSNDKILSTEYLHHTTYLFSDWLFAEKETHLNFVLW